MCYIYGATVERTEYGTYWLRFPDFPGAYEEAESYRDVIVGAAEVLKLFIAEWLDRKGYLPEATINEGTQVVVCVEMAEDYIEETKLLTVKEAAEYLEVSPSRVSQLLGNGQLEAREFHGRRMVTLDSVNDRIANKPAAHRPRRGSGASA